MDTQRFGKRISTFIRRVASVATSKLGLIIKLAVLAAAPIPASAMSSVSMSWSPSSDSTVTAYNVYYGGASGVYTNKISVGNVTSATISNLNAGTYYFSATAVNSSGIESGYSAEIAYTVTNSVVTTNSGKATLAMNIATVSGVPQISISASGTVPTQWAIQASSDLVNWTNIAAGTNTAVNFSMPANASIAKQFFRLVGP